MTVSDHQLSSEPLAWLDWEDEQQVHELAIRLFDATIAIERRVLVSADIRLPDLHLVIQAAMGWSNYHLHLFELDDGGPAYADPELDELDTLDETDVRLSQLLADIAEALTYEYDFGDYWRHRIVLLDTHPAEADADVPACTGGRGACPPEDCGGVSGYAQLCRAIGDPEAEDHAERLEWASPSPAEPSDPDAFDLTAAHRRVRGLVGADGRLRWPPLHQWESETSPSPPRARRWLVAAVRAQPALRGRVELIASDIDEFPDRADVELQRAVTLDDRMASCGDPSLGAVPRRRTRPRRPRARTSSAHWRSVHAMPRGR